MLENTAVSLLVFVVGFGFLIFIHELGHFLVAKCVGIRCTQFAIGFGHALLSWRRGLGLRVGSTESQYLKRLEEGVDPDSLGETEYRLNWMPLGGYVKMLGQEDLDPAARSADPRSFTSKSVGRRFAVISAGVVMNVIFGVLFFIVAFRGGVQFPPAIVGGVLSGSPAATTLAQGHDGDLTHRGLQVGDRIVQIDQETIDDWLDLAMSIALGPKQTPRAVLVERRGEDKPLRYMITPEPGRMEGLLSIGVMRSPALFVGAVGPDSEEAKAGVEPEMRITAVEGRPVADYAEYSRALAARRGLPAVITFEDEQGGRTVQAPQSAAPRLVQWTKDEPANLVGLVPAVRIVGIVEGGPAEAVGVQLGDLIANLGGEPWPDLDRVPKLVKRTEKQKGPIKLVVWREGRPVALGPVKAKRGKIGVSLGLMLDEPIIGRTKPGSSAAALNLPGGTRILACNGQPVTSWADLQRVIGSVAAAGGRTELAIRYRLSIAGQHEEQTKLWVDPEEISRVQHAGWQPRGRIELLLLQTMLKSDSAVAATALGFKKTHQFMYRAYLMLTRLFQGSVKVKHLSGPAGIVHAGAQFTQRGWPYLLFFLGLLSVNLAVVNFLPIPIADGGHAVFLLIEKIKGSPVSAKVQVAAMYFGLALLAVVFLVVTYNDFVRIFRFRM